MIGLIKGDGPMPPDQAFRGCLALSAALSMLIASTGLLIFLLSKAGCT
jgi:hypothetical protein